MSAGPAPIDRPEPNVSPSHAEDLALVRAARAGDEQAVARLADRLTCVRHFLVARQRRIGATLDAEELSDLVQDVVVAVWERLDDYSGWAALETWVHPFCVNKLANALAKHRRRGGVLESDDGTVIGAAADRTPTEESAADPERLQRALDRLGPPKADVVRMRHFDGLEFDAIARRFDVPLETAKTWYYRGLKALKTMLGDDGGAA